MFEHAALEDSIGMPQVFKYFDIGVKSFARFSNRYAADMQCSEQDCSCFSSTFLGDKFFWLPRALDVMSGSWPICQNRVSMACHKLNSELDAKAKLLSAM